ncbi:MAG: phosphoenolpyruvate--protein phosphotransferase [Planctomycetota bacterium]
MDVPHSIFLLIQGARTFREILDGAVDLVRREMGTDVCSIYLLDPRDRRLHLMATRGLDPGSVGRVALALGEGLTGTVVQTMQPLAVEDAAAHPAYRYFPETKEEEFASYLGVPLAIRRRPVGAIAVQTRDRRAYSPEEIRTLTVISGQLVGIVENARLIDALERGQDGLGYLEEQRSARALEGPEARGEGELVLAGVPASAGIAIGAAVFTGPAENPPPEALESQGEDAERKRLEAALEKTREEVIRIRDAAERDAGEECALIFSSHLLVLNDPALRSRIEARLRAGESAYRAVDAELEHFSAKLESVGNAYVQERAEDIRDLRNRLLGHLAGKKPQPSQRSDRIVVSRGLPPSFVVELKAEGAAGLVAERGGPTAHGMLLARSLGIPAVSGIAGATAAIRPGETVIADGTDGRVVVSPSEATRKEYELRLRRLAVREEETRRYCALPSRSKDGVRIALHANVGVSADLPLAVRNGAEGIGLYRTEFPFILRHELPSEEEQVRIYRKAYEYFPEGPVVFRLLDIGGDKVLPSMAIAADRNPFRGYRSIRVLLENPEVLRDQAKAFARAAGPRPLAILIPMVSSLTELRAAVGHIRAALDEVADPEAQRSPRIGAMIEVPAAVELAPELAREVDFFSIGSNDLAQYALAVDRESSSASSPLDDYHPALFRLLSRTVEAGRRAGIPVSLCGEIARNPRLAVFLAALGIHSLSVAPAALPELKRALASAEVAPMREALQRLLALDDARAVQEALRGLVPLED